MSKWRAGQCVTIEGKRYRVTKVQDKYANYTCIFCKFVHTEPYCYPCSACKDSMQLMQYDCYLKEIKPKS